MKKFYLTGPDGSPKSADAVRAFNICVLGLVVGVFMVLGLDLIVRFFQGLFTCVQAGAK